MENRKTGRVGRPPKAEVKKERRNRAGRTGALKGPHDLPEGRNDRDFVYHFFNDSPGNLQKHIANDWDFVDETGNSSGVDKGSAYTVYSGLNKDGTPLIAYYMRKPREWAEEDEAAKQATIDKQMKGMAGGDSGNGSTYTPSEGIRGI